MWSKCIKYDQFADCNPTFLVCCYNFFVRMKAMSVKLFPFQNLFSVSRVSKFIGLLLGTVFVAVSVCLLPAVSSSPDAATAPIHVVGRIRLEIPDEKYNEYVQKTSTLFTETEEKDRPILYTCNQDINDSGLFVWDEKWQSYNALQKHLDSSHFKKWYSFVKTYQVGDLNVVYAPVEAFKNV